MIVVDTVKAFDPSLDESSDFLDIEWFEVNKSLINRQTVQGVLLQISKDSRQKWADGDTLWANEQYLASIRIKPCLAIKIRCGTARQVSDFCFYIGNRHLPLFVDPLDQSLVVPYDGHLYDQLKGKFQADLELFTTKLLIRNALDKNISIR